MVLWDDWFILPATAPLERRGDVLRQREPAMTATQKRNGRIWLRVIAGAAVALLPAGGVAAQNQAPRRAVAIEDYYRIERVESPAISPDGRLVAFVRSFIIETENRRQSEIWLVPADGSAPPRRITHPAFSSSSPRWSPDGRLLAVSSRRKVPGAAEEESSIWFLDMTALGGEAFQIPGVGGAPIFSPDNKWIAFTRKAPVSRKPRYASESERVISERFKGRMYDWMNFRFDQRGYLADPRDPEATPPEELYVVPREGGTPRQLTRLGVDVQSAAWAADSGALALVADAHQRDEYTYERADVWVVTLDGTVRRLTDDGYNYDAAAWSPDGTWIVARRGQSLNQVIQARQNHGGPVDLVRIAAGGGAPENLTPDWDLIPNAPRWSPDGRYVYFTAGRGGSTHLFRLQASGETRGKDVQPVTTGDRQLSGLSLTAAFDRIAYAAADSSHPHELFTATIGAAGAAGERKLTGFNDGFLRDVDLSAAQRIEYPSRDGTPIEGWIVLPRGYDPSAGPYPLILAIHGGPHSAYANDFSFQFQYWAASGCIVLFTNPRGSTGYGEKFLWATWGGWGVLDYDDVMAGVDHVVARYAVDVKRLGVTGYSYGGFLTNWIIGRTSRFAAAIVGAGISNWISDYGTADIPRTKETEFYGPPWEPKGRELLTKLSPLTNVANVVTPTLFIHGESDFRVPIEQGEQMYTALTKRKVPAKFVRYPDSYHGGWTPWNTVHRYDQELTWWKQHVGPARSATDAGARDQGGFDHP